MPNHTNIWINWQFGLFIYGLNGTHVYTSVSRVFFFTWITPAAKAQKSLLIPAQREARYQVQGASKPRSIYPIPAWCDPICVKAMKSAGEGNRHHDTDILQHWETCGCAGWYLTDSDEYVYCIPNPECMPKYTKAKVLHTQDKHTQLSSFTELCCHPIKSLAAPSLPEYVDTHPQPTGYLRP